MLQSTRAPPILGNLTEMVGTKSDIKFQKFFTGHIKRNYIYNYDLPSTNAGSRKQLKASNVELAIKFVTDGRFISSRMIKSFHKLERFFLPDIHNHK